MNLLFSAPRAALAWLGLATATFAAHAATLTVPTDHASIQAAIDAAAPGDKVQVLPGVYAENLNFRGKAIEVVGKRGYRQTRIVGAPNAPVVLMDSGETRASQLSGFTIEGGVGFYGGGVDLAGASPTIRHNRFIGNTGAFASAIGGNGSSPLIEHNLFEQQNCFIGDFLSGVLVFINYSSPRIVSNIIHGNPCTAIDMVLPEGTEPLVANNTLVGNDTGIRVDARVPTRLQRYQNNILSGHRLGLSVLFLSPGQEPSFEHNLLHANGQDYDGIPSRTGQDGNRAADPLFVDAKRGNFRLGAGSVGIDTGKRLPGSKGSQDFYGAPRVSDGNLDGEARIDIGAAEFTAP